MRDVMELPKIQKALAFLKADDENTLREQLEMCQIPAPSHQEKKKAEYVLRKMQEIGLEDVHMDAVWNVFGTIKGSGGGPKLLFAGHTDTVFPAGTDLTVHEENGCYRCPGINDDTRAVAELLSIARAMKTSGLHGEGDIVFCANVCEEGLGDLKGVKYIFENSNDYDGFVSIDNPVTGGIVYTATGSRRFRVTFRGLGGHSFADFGIPSPIHALGRAMSRIADFQVPLMPKTTFNIGVIEGGTSVNTIAESASMLVDIRSDSPEELKRLSAELEAAVCQAEQEENGRQPGEEGVKAEIELVGNRPAGTQPKDCKIVCAAWSAAEILGITPELRDESSTDANIPISLGIPAITVGRGGEEGGVHTVHEWFKPVDAYLGPQKNMLLILLLSGVEGVREYQLARRNP